MSMQTVRRIADVRRICADARRSDQTVGLVPTMGAFHTGHRSLMRAARGECDLVVVSLFVNPTQFGPNEDLAGYPRDEAGDASAAAAEGVDLLFAPSVDEMYPEEPRTTVHVAGLTDRLCGASRPGHFDGVTTVVTKLFSIVGPCRAYFGRKDAQQLAVVRKMTRDLDLPVEVVGCPLVREPDGIAMSSRNAYLDDEQRAAATVLSRALHQAATHAAAGQSAESVRALVRELVDPSRSSSSSTSRSSTRRRSSRSTSSPATCWSRSPRTSAGRGSSTTARSPCSTTDRPSPISACSREAS